jgi:acyl-CoA thioesterase FadM
VGTTSLTLNFDFFGEENQVRATGYLVIVCKRRSEASGMPWPKEFLDRLERYRMSPDEARAGRGTAA